MLANYRYLNDDGIRNLVEYLLKVEERAGLYRDLTKMAEGQFLLADLKTRLETVRKLYSSIEPWSPEAPYVLAGLQGSEREIGNTISEIQTHVEHGKEAALMRGEIQKFLKERRERNRRNVSLLPSTRVKKQETDNDSRGRSEGGG